MPGASSRTAIHCATISHGSRLRIRPRRPVAQKVHPIAQPAWLEMQTVNFPAASSGIRTASASAPSCSRKRYFTKPSLGSVARSTIGAGGDAVLPFMLLDQLEAIEILPADAARLGEGQPLRRRARLDVVLAEHRLAGAVEMFAAELLRAPRTGRRIVEIGQLTLGQHPHRPAALLADVAQTTLAAREEVEALHFCAVVGHGHEDRIAPEDHRVPC